MQRPVVLLSCFSRRRNKRWIEPIALGIVSDQGKSMMIKAWRVAIFGSNDHDFGNTEAKNFKGLKGSTLMHGSGDDAYRQQTPHGCPERGVFVYQQFPFKI